MFKSLNMEEMQNRITKDISSKEALVEVTPFDFNSTEKEIDVVEVVRCKDCIFAECYHEKFFEPKYICNNTGTPWFVDTNVYMNANDFCSYGKRNEKQDEDS